MSDPAEPTPSPFLPPRLPRVAATLAPSVVPAMAPSVTPSMEPTTAGMYFIEVAPPPVPAKRKRWVAVVGVAAVVAIGAGVAAVAVGGSDSADAGYSLKAATAAAESAQNVAFEMTTTLGDAGVVEASGRFDTEQHLMAMDLSTAAFGDSQVSVVLDVDNTVMYMDTAAFAGHGIEAPTKWVRIDLGEFPALAEVFQQSSSNNPLDVAQVFDKAKSVDDLGMEDFRGEQVKHFHVTVVTADALAAYPALQQQIDQMGSDFPAEMSYEVYVSGDSQLRRVVYEVPMAGQTIGADLVLTAVGSIDPISIPSPDEVTDMSTLISG